MGNKNKDVVYMLECKDGTLYTGYTNNLERRIAMHENGKGAKYTRGRGPFRLVYCQSFSTKEEAMHEEYRIKQLSRKQKDKLIKSFTEGHDGK
ncbi:GIY-YIG nuclease family protein [Virgibacillus senegalensis]|uniref:GIY-YIG nuclease family protein n=1 Tax=Virgibacillus senegalensis TaxID=1499679 RepID=UPI00069EDD84|nr:GIY-YIG nuclease family protein [Virgibacillus senegalensis]